MKSRTWSRWLFATILLLGRAASAEAQAPAAFKGPAQESAKDQSTPEPNARPTEVDRTKEPATNSRLRQREGAKLIDYRGRFERRGDRYVFLAETSAAHYIVLENLMLERVGTVLGESAGGQLSWNVSGTVTEFRGTNFLLLQRAVVKSAAGPKEPKRLDDSTAARPMSDRGVQR